MAWIELASHLRMSLQRCQRETSSKEFIDWCRHLRERATRCEPLHWYLARIAMEIRSAANPKITYKLKDFPLDFESEEVKTKELTEAEKKTRLERSKMFWKALTSNYTVRDPPSKGK